jgi:large subunit ribosomal protein L1
MTTTDTINDVIKTVSNEVSENTSNNTSNNTTDNQEQTNQEMDSSNPSEQSIESTNNQESPTPQPKVAKIQVVDKGRSRKYKLNAQKVRDFLKNNPNPNLEQALGLLASLDQPNFKNGVSVELHIKANIDATKSDQLIRGSVSLPHGTGKEVKIACFVNPENVEVALKAGATLAGGEELIEQIKNSQKVDFDKAIAQPDMMKKLPVIARLLGTAGVMPNPKTGTVGDNIEEMIKEIKAGKIDYRNDKTGNVHIMCGRLNSSFSTKQLMENIQSAYDSVIKAKPEGVKKKYIIATHLATAQSPSVPVYFN